MTFSVRFSFFILAAVLAFERVSYPLLLIEWLVVVTFSVLAHELGHALAFRKFGHGSHITLHGLGGLTQSKGGPALTHLQSAFVSVSGPLMGFLVALIVWGVVKAAPEVVEGPLAERVVFDLLWVNVGWSVINLLPIVPMDGGHLMQSLLRHRLGEKAEMPALAISLVVALLCGVAALKAGWTWSLVMVAWFAVINVQAIMEHRRHERLAGVREIMQGAVEAFYRRDFASAGALALDALGQTNDSEVRGQLRQFILTIDGAAGQSQELQALRARREWQATLEAARAAQAHDPTKLFE